MKKLDKDLSPTHVGKIIYGLSLMDISWKDLEVDEEMEKNFVDMIDRACLIMSKPDRLNDEVSLMDCSFFKLFVILPFFLTYFLGFIVYNGWCINNGI
jgi:hypothetical protein